jgi:MFS family permease
VIYLNAEFKSSHYDLRKYSVLLFATYTLFGLAFSSYSYQLRYYAEHNGIDYSFQSKLESISYILVALFILNIGKISDLVGRERAVFITSAVGSLSPVIALLSISPVSFFFSVLALNSAFLGGAVARNLLAIEIGGVKTGSVVGMAMTGTAVAMIFGPIIGDLLKGSFGFFGVFSFSSSMFVGSALVSFFMKTGKSGVMYKGWGISSIPSELRGFATFATLDRFAYYIWVPLIFALTASEGISIQSSALLYSIQNAAWLIFQFPMGILADRWDPRKLLSLSEILTSLSAIMLAVGIVEGGDIVALSSSFALLGLNIASWAPSYSSYFMKKTTGERRGIYMASINFYATIAAIPSPFVGGALRSIIPGGYGHLLFAAALHAINAAYVLRIR